MRFIWKRPDRDKTTGEPLTLGQCCKELVAVGLANSMSDADKYFRRHVPEEGVYQTAIMDHIRKKAAEKGWKCKIWKAVAGSYATSGVSDVVGVVNGVFIAVEVKRPLLGKPTELQKSFITQIEAAGGLGCVAVYPEDVDERLWNRLEDRINGKYRH